MHEPLVALTDFALFCIALYCAYMLRTIQKSQKGIVRLFQFQFVFLGLAALFGAIFHAFFPLKDATLSGLFVWLLVCGSIAGTAHTMVLVMAESFSIKTRKMIRNTFLLLLTLFMLVIAFYKRTYDVVLMFYAPVLSAYFFYACYATKRNPEWKLVGVGLFLSILAGIFQGSGVRIGPLDHNTIYHIVQAGALIVLFRGYQNAGRA